MLARDDVSTIAIAGGIGISTKGIGVGVAVIVAVTNQDVRAAIGNGAQGLGRRRRQRARHRRPTRCSRPQPRWASPSRPARPAPSSSSCRTRAREHLAPTRASAAGAVAADRVTLTAGGDLEVSARSAIDDSGDATPIRLYAGGLAIGAGSAGIGLAASVLVRSSRVGASVGQGATLDARATTASTTPGVMVSASQLGDIMLIAIAGGAGKYVGIAGSTTVNVLTDTTTASIGTDALVNQTQRRAPRVARTSSSSPPTTRRSWPRPACSPSAASAGIGAGADVEVIDKTTTATVGARSRIVANGDVVVSATSSEHITSISVGGAVGGSVAIALNAGVSVVNVTTSASLGADTVVVAGGNVLVTADEVLELLIVAGNVTASGSSVGAGAAVPVLTKTTTATVGDRAKVTAYGLAGRVGHGTVATGGYTMTQQDPRFDPRGFSDGNPIPQGLDPGDPEPLRDRHADRRTASARGQQVIYDNGGGADDRRSRRRRTPTTSTCSARPASPSR